MVTDLLKKREPDPITHAGALVQVGPENHG